MTGLFTLRPPKKVTQRCQEPNFGRAKKMPGAILKEAELHEPTKINRLYRALLPLLLTFAAGWPSQDFSSIDGELRQLQNLNQQPRGRAAGYATLVSNQPYPAAQSGRGMCPSQTINDTPRNTEARETLLQPLK
jgi:hypothetical protein